MKCWIRHPFRATNTELGGSKPSVPAAGQRKIESRLPSVSMLPSVVRLVVTIAIVAEPSAYLSKGMGMGMVHEHGQLQAQLEALVHVRVL